MTLLIQWIAAVWTAGVAVPVASFGSQSARLQPEPADPARPATPAAHPSLRLTLAEKAPDARRFWEPLQLDWTITNHSPDKSIPYLPPGDGSIAGYREPTIRYRVWRKAEGDQWVPVQWQPPLTCKTINHDWRDQVVLLEPGKHHCHTEHWIPPPPLEPQPAATLRVVAEYRYDARPAGTLSGDALPPAEAHGSMAGVEPCTITSEPIELTVDQPLRLEVRQLKPLPVGVEIDLADYVAIEIRNVSGEAIAVSAAAGESAWVQVAGWQNVSLRQEGLDTRYSGATVIVKPNAVRSVVGIGDGAARLPRIRLDPSRRQDSIGLTLEAVYARPGWTIAVTAPVTHLTVAPARCPER